MHNIDYNLVWNIAAVVIGPIIYFGVSNFNDSRRKLISHYGHIRVFKLKNREDVLTHSVVIRNNGYKPITGIKLEQVFFLRIFMFILVLNTQLMRRPKKLYFLN